MDWKTISMFGKVPDMEHPLEDTFASEIYHGWNGKQGTWESLPAEERERWRVKARRFAQGDHSVACWQRKVREADVATTRPAWL